MDLGTFDEMFPREVVVGIAEIVRKLSTDDLAGLGHLFLGMGEDANIAVEHPDAAGTGGAFQLESNPSHEAGKIADTLVGSGFGLKGGKD